MPSPIQSQTLKQIRQSIGYNLQDMILVTATTTVDTSSLIGNLLTLPGPDDEYNGRYLYAATPTGSIVAAEKSRASDFDSATRDITASPVFSASIANGDIFEVWKVFTVEEINDAINQAINDVSAKALQIKETVTTFTESSKYLYNVLSGFTHLYQVEYVYKVGTEKILHRCDAAWAELADPTGVTSSLDTSFKKQGSGSIKLVMTAGAATGLLKTAAITSLDISGTTQVQIWIYSTVALSAGDIQLLLDDTAECASPVESLNIPATTANIWTRHIISLANPQSDSAIISVGLKMIVDKGAGTIWADDIKAIDEYSNQYKELPIEYWGIAQAGTPLLKLTSGGLSLAGTGTQLKLSGFQIPVRMTADTDTSEIDPAYVIAKTVGELLLNHAKSSFLDIQDRQSKGDRRLLQAARMEIGITTTLPGTVRSIKG